jgi:hypothetical protein
MEHFSTQEWLDFIRGSGSPEKAADIKEHLDGECPECIRSQQIWGSVMKQTRQSRRTEPPQAALRAVKAGFGLRKVVPFPSGKLDLAMLQFDSERQPLAAGMRSGQSSARQLLYRSGNVCIDMRMQPTPGTESVLLIGQLLDSMDPGRGLGGIAVSLLSKGGTMLSKKTNDAGEFDFGLETSRDIQLVFGIGDKRTIVVAVPERADGSQRVM